MTPEEMADRATLAFVGVIRSQKFINWPWGAAGEGWGMLLRRVTVETIARGQESRKEVDLYEYYGTLGASGNWNATFNGERYYSGLQLRGRWEENKRLEAEGLARAIRLLRETDIEESYDPLRLLSTISNPEVRRRICDLFRRRIPRETDHGCPPNPSAPASYVTADGEVLLGPGERPPAARRAPA